MASQLHSPRWYTIPVRVLLITFVCTLLAFAVSLMVGILSTVTIALHRHANPNMTVAYRHIALPAALVAGGVIFLAALVVELRHYRQSKALAAIARISQHHPLSTLLP
jgi:uncharacterized membrane protein